MRKRDCSECMAVKRRRESPFIYIFKKVEQVEQHGLSPITTGFSGVPPFFIEGGTEIFKNATEANDCRGSWVFHLFNPLGGTQWRNG